MHEHLDNIEELLRVLALPHFLLLISSIAEEDPKMAGTDIKVPYLPYHRLYRGFQAISSGRRLVHILTDRRVQESSRRHPDGTEGGRLSISLPCLVMFRCSLGVRSTQGTLNASLHEAQMPGPALGRSIRVQQTGETV